MVRPHPFLVSFFFVKVHAIAQAVEPTHLQFCLREQHVCYAHGARAFLVSTPATLLVGNKIFGLLADICYLFSPLGVLVNRLDIIAAKPGVQHARKWAVDEVRARVSSNTVTMATSTFTSSPLFVSLVVLNTPDTGPAYCSQQISSNSSHGQPRACLEEVIGLPFTVRPSTLCLIVRQGPLSQVSLLIDSCPPIDTDLCYGGFM